MSDRTDLLDEIEQLEERLEQAVIKSDTQAWRANKAEDTVRKLKSDLIDVCHSAKKIVLAYMGYHETNLEPDIQRINRMAAQHMTRGTVRMDAEEWWGRLGSRRDISKMTEEERMKWAYNQGLSA